MNDLSWSGLADAPLEDVLARVACDVHGAG